ncbi:MAG: hypothetical protein EPN39_12690 [Chitinophagaceae bacterium]|nr:MAG: hypothetical protein EPN39_12690 [Chitinophagaceae bacterium]
MTQNDRNHIIELIKEMLPIEGIYKLFADEKNVFLVRTEEKKKVPTWRCPFTALGIPMNPEMKNHRKEIHFSF